MASGGMGTVYRGRDLVRGDRVAVKVVREATAEMLERLRREADVLSELQHPALVGFRACGEIQGVGAYIVLDWIDGFDLARRLRHGPLAFGDALELGRQLASGLASAHKRGIIHRDVKPQNVILRGGAPTRPVLIDFGIATLAGLPSGLTMVGLTIGTPGYMAPEQARGEAEMDARADVYGLGCLLFHCLAGSPPFVGDSAVAIVAESLLSEPPRLSSRMPAVPAAVDEFVSTLLAKERSKRPADGSEVERSLVELIRDLDAGEQREPHGVSHVERRMLVAVSVVLNPTRDSLDPMETTIVDDPPRSSAASRRDPELRTSPIRGAFLPALASRFGGVLQAIHSKGLCATWSSTDSAMESAQRAARFALATIESDPLSAVGVAMGPSAVGAAPDEAIVTQATTLASEAGRALVSASTQALLANEFSLHEFAPNVLELAHGHVTDALRTSRPLRGRDRELALLEGSFVAVCEDRRAQVLFLTAEPGFGKTRLLRAFQERRESVASSLCLYASANSVSTDTPLALVRLVVARALIALGSLGGSFSTSEQALAGLGQRSEWSARVPYLRRCLGEEVDTERGLATRDPLLIEAKTAEALGDLLTELGEHATSLVLAIDDADQADFASMRVLSLTIRRASQGALLCLIAAAKKVDPTFETRLGAVHCERIRVAKLSKLAASLLVRDELGERASTKRVTEIVNLAEGHPTLLRELVQQAVVAGEAPLVPTTLVASLESKLSRLDPELRRVLRAASIFDGAFWLGGLLAILGTDDKRLVAAQLSLLADRDLIAASSASRFDDESEWTFAQPLLRDAAYGMLADADKLRGHALAAEWLVKMGESDDASLARHFEASGELEFAAVHWLAAARRAFALGDNAVAASLSNRTIGLAPDSETLTHAQLLLGELLAVGQHPLEALRLLREAASAFPRHSQRWLEATMLEASVSMQHSASNHVDLVRELVTLLRNRPELVPKPHLLSHFVAWCLRHRLADLANDVIEVLGEAAARGSPDDRGVPADLLRCRSWLAAFAGNYDLCLRHDREALRIATAVDDVRRTARCMVDIGYDLLMLGDFTEARDQLRGAIALAEPRGLVFLASSAKHNLGVALHRLGDDEAALALELRSIEEAQATGDLLSAAQCQNYAGQIYVALGQLEEAQLQFERALGVATLPHVRCLIVAWLARVALRRGQPALAELRIREAESIAETVVLEEEWFLVPLVRIELLEERGETSAAEQAVREVMTKLVARADLIHDPALQKLFLTAIPDHRAIMERARKAVSSTLTGAGRS